MRITIRAVLGTIILVLLGLSLSGCVYYAGYGSGYCTVPAYGGGYWQRRGDDDGDET